MITLQQEVLEAFAERSRPDSVVFAEGAALSEDYDDALFFNDKTNLEITCGELEAHPDCVFGFTPAAFLYFLPGIFVAAIEENRPDILVVHSLVSMLDRGNAPNSWDDFFSARWPALNSRECSATQKWILWLSEFENMSVGDSSLSRAFDTISLIAQQSSAYPIAKFRT